MNKKQYIKIAIVSLFITAALFGTYFYVIFNLKMYNTLKQEQLRTTIMLAFIQQQFPDQVKAFQDSLPQEVGKSATNENVETLPTNKNVK